MGMNFSELPPDCQWALRELFEARGGEEPAENSEQLRRHLETCARCQRARDWDDLLGAAMTELPFPPVPLGLEERVRSRLARPRRWRYAAVGIAAALLAAAGLILGTWRPWREPQPVAVTPDPPGANGPNGMNEAAALFATPLVHPLDVLDQQQDALFVALDQMKKE